MDGRCRGPPGSLGCRSSAGHRIARAGPGGGARPRARRRQLPESSCRVDPTRPATDDRVIHTGFAALDAILGPGGLPRNASVAIRGDGSSGRTTLVLRLAAEAQAAGSIVAWLDLSRSFDPVEAVARGVRLEWLVVITPETLDEGLAIGGALLAGRSVDLLVLDLPGGRLAATDRPARIADRLGRLAALARRSETLFVVLEPPGDAGGLATAVAEATGLRLELARRSWIRLGRDVVGQRTEALVARNRYGPPGRRATLRILYAEGGERDACLRRDDLLLDEAPDPAPAIDERTTRDATPPSPPAAPPPRTRPGASLRASFPPGPLILGGRPWDPGPVVDANPEARALGVRRGMPLGSAHRLVPEATFIDPDPDADRATVEAAFEALAAFSPGIAGSADPADAAFGLFEVQVDGLEPLWGPEPVLVERLVEALGGSWAAAPARSGPASPAPASARPWPRSSPAPARRSSSRPVARPTFLAPHPSGLLTPDPDVRARLTRFGLRRIGAVAELDRTALVARFGEEGARIHARAHGEELEPFRPRRAPERLRLALPIEPAVEDLEPLRFVLHRLAAALTGQLVARGLAASRARLHLDLDLAFARAGTPAELDVEQRFPEPTADAEAIERLLFARLERTPPPAAVARLALELDGTAPAAGQQLPLFTPQAARGARLEWQLARLALTFGEDRVRRVDITDPEAPLPEHRWTWRPVISDDRGVPR